MPGITRVLALSEAGRSAAESKWAVQDSNL